MGAFLFGSKQRYKFKQMEFWAEYGRIHMLDYRKSPYTPEYTSRTIEDIVELIKSFRDMIPRMKYPSEIREYENLVQALLAVGVQAKAQGDPHDEKVSEHFRRHRSKKGNFLVPGKDIGTTSPALMEV